jgi:hypothetical protein
MKLIRKTSDMFRAACIFLVASLGASSVLADVPTPEGVGTADENSGAIAYSQSLWNLLAQWAPTILSFGAFLFLGWNLLAKFLEERKSPKPDYGNLVGHGIGVLVVLALSIFFAFQASQVGTIS